MQSTYILPRLYHQLKSLDAKLQKEGYSLDEEFGLRLTTDFPHYHVTPLDLIPFGDIGMDGIHYGFLTDFGTVHNLEDAYIVLISPMDFGDPHKIVAKNFREFLNLAWTLKGATNLANVRYSRTQKEYVDLIKYLEESEEEADDIYLVEQAYVLQRIQETFGLQPINDMYHYIENEVKLAREQQTVLSTLDGLGVVGETPEDPTHKKFKLKQDQSFDESELGALLQSSSNESKLALLRDIQFTGDFTYDFSYEEIVVKILEEQGLSEELKNFRQIRSL